MSLKRKVTENNENSEQIGEIHWQQEFHNQLEREETEKNNFTKHLDCKPTSIIAIIGGKLNETSQLMKYFGKCHNCVGFSDDRTVVMKESTEPSSKFIDASTLSSLVRINTL